MEELNELYQSLNDNCRYFQVRFEECKKTEDSLRALLEYARKNVPDTKETVAFIYQILKINQLITITALDAIPLCQGCILTGENDWRNKFYCKYAYLNMYEFFNFYDKYNNVLYRIVKEEANHYLPSYERAQTTIKEIKKRNIFKNRNFIETVRNKTAGHIDADFNVYYDTVKLLKKETIIECLDDLIGILRVLQNMLFELIEVFSQKLEAKIQELSPFKIELVNLLSDNMTSEQLDSLIQELSLLQQDENLTL